ncbi:MAG: TIGR00282 family metallophosphoesterase [Cyanobacteria bacterium P01_A01_bin.68]
MGRILFIGDIVGSPGRKAVKKYLAEIRESHAVDWVIANGENAAAGKGITGALCYELYQAGVDRITLGDHVWDQRGFSEELDSLENVCRPFNLPASVPGRAYETLDLGNGKTLGIATLLGRQFMKISSSCQYEALDALMKLDDVDFWFIETHAEATAEKVGLGWYMDGRAVAVIGTHTHVPTADESILPRGTAYLSDAGMTGPYHSVLGREVAPVIASMRDGMPRRFEVAQHDVRICGCLIDFDTETGVATKIERFRRNVSSQN